MNPRTLLYKRETTKGFALVCSVYVVLVLEEVVGFFYVCRSRTSSPSKGHSGSNTVVRVAVLLRDSGLVGFQTIGALFADGVGGRAMAVVDAKVFCEKRRKSIRIILEPECQHLLSFLMCV